MKHILVVVALLMAILPCSHAAAHHDCGHDSAMELCALDTSPCECHACSHQPCSEDIEILADQASASETIEQPAIPALLFVLPEVKPVLRQSLPPVSGILATLQSVQLLI